MLLWFFEMFTEFTLISERFLLMLLTLMLIDALSLDSFTNSANVVFVKVAYFELSNDMFFELVDIYTKFDLMLTMLILTDEVLTVSYEVFLLILAMFLLMLEALTVSYEVFLLILAMFLLMLEEFTVSYEVFLLILAMFLLMLEVLTVSYEVFLLILLMLWLMHEILTLTNE